MKRLVVVVAACLHCWSPLRVAALISPSQGLVVAPAAAPAADVDWRQGRNDSLQMRRAVANDTAARRTGYLNSSGTISSAGDVNLDLADGGLLEDSLSLLRHQRPERRLGIAATSSVFRRWSGQSSAACWPWCCCWPAYLSCCSA
eukprot:TRINITY_DN8880_c0_g1_i2.p1 TRINITY_DN8880_c0_g1~~TRINITY_DN8880_c0_g1_i2.p1  ORF type:complete len:145 (+),score=19.35 TRINITY_DN8880_c0_g1_i2:104-538(+)